MPAAAFSYNKKQSFGLIDFDTTKPDPTVTYRIVTIDREIVHTFTVGRSQLKKGGEQIMMKSPGADRRQ